MSRWASFFLVLLLAGVLSLSLGLAGIAPDLVLRLGEVGKTTAGGVFGPRATYGPFELEDGDYLLWMDESQFGSEDDWDFELEDEYGFDADIWFEGGRSATVIDGHRCVLVGRVENVAEGEHLLTMWYYGDRPLEEVNWELDLYVTTAEHRVYIPLILVGAMALGWGSSGVLATLGPVVVDRLRGAPASPRAR